MLVGVVEVLSAVLLVCGVSGALIASGAWLSERKFSSRSSRQAQGESSARNERR